MTLAHAIALGLIPFLAAGATLLASFSQKVRDIFFFALLFLAVFSERMDVHFFSEAWYRGTTRGVEVSLLEILAFSIFAGSLLSRRDSGRRWVWPVGLAPLLVYFAYACLSVSFSEPKLFGVFELSKIFASILVFLASATYLRSRREWTFMLVALAMAVSLEGAWAIKQRIFTALTRTPGTLDHPNSLSMYFCLAAPTLVAAALGGWTRMLRWLCGISVLLATIGILLTVSRAGLPVFAVTVLAATIACTSWHFTPRRIIVTGLLAAAIAALVAGSWSRIAERYNEVSLEEEYMDPSVDGRGIYLRLAKAISSDHFFGVGLNNWSYYVSESYGPDLGFHFENYDHLVSVYGKSDTVFANSYLAAPAHNLIALTLGELGIPGILIFGVLWLRWFWVGASFFKLARGDPMRTLGVGIFFSIWGIFGQSLTEWVYRQTPILFTFYILLGGLAGLAAARVQAIRGPVEQVPEGITSEEAPELAMVQLQT